MRQILICIILSLSLSINAQKEEQVIIEPILTPMVAEFVYEADKRALDIAPRIVALDSIVFTDDMRILGKYENNVVYINYFLQVDDFQMKVVLYHELFHALGLEHCHVSCLHLLGAGKPVDFTFSLYYDKEIWKVVLDKEFNKLL